MNIQERHDIFMQRMQAITPTPTTIEESKTALMSIFRCDDEATIEHLLRLYESGDKLAAITVVAQLLCSDNFMLEEGAPRPIGLQARHAIMVQRMNAVTPAPESRDETRVALMRVLRCDDEKTIEALMDAIDEEGEESTDLSWPIVSQLLNAESFLTEMDVLPVSKPLGELLDIFMARAQAVDPIPETREDIVKTMAMLYRVTEREAEIFMQLHEANDMASVKSLVTEWMTRESFLSEPGSPESPEQPQP